jgi:DUF1680 family protein
MKTYNLIIITPFVAIVFLMSCNSKTIEQSTTDQLIQTDYPIRPVEFTKVNITNGFWKSRIDTAAKITIPYSFRKCEETGRIDNFVFAGGIREGKFRGKFGFDDSDVYKIMEGASYSLMNEYDPDLKLYLDTLISYISAAQEDDGYLYTAWTLKANDYADMACCSYSEEGKFVNSRWSHELYNAGHMYEAAVAHYRATGERSFLDVAIKNADLIYRLCVEEDEQFYPGHQEIELGLVKLYRATGVEKYLELAKLFLDRRGQGLTDYRNDGERLHEYDIYSQDHTPVTEQSEAVGHSVRAGYMYAAMADIAAIAGDRAYLDAINRLWENIVSKKLYITGGLGAGNGIEGFDVAYALPNDAYAETCAAIANVYWNHRMFLLHGDAKYMDVLERTLYNGLIVGLSLNGNEFFYPNPLIFNGERKFNQGAVCRSPWFDCSCCPSNLSRFVPSVSGYVYASTDSDVYINLFMESHSEIEMNGKTLELIQETNYPWSGDISISIGNTEPIEAHLKIRIPGWAKNQVVPSDLYTFIKAPTQTTEILVNGEPKEYIIEKGYAVLQGEWSKGDIIEVHLPMEVRTIKSHEDIVDNRGKTAVQCGPILYCAEAVDNDGHAIDLTIDPESSSFTVEYRENLLNGVNVIKGKGMAGDKEVPVQLIPYNVWNHREISPMAVWINESI